MKIKTASLTEAALDWAVAKCEGLKHEYDGGANWIYPEEFLNYGLALNANKASSLPCMRFSDDWAIGGPIIERECVSTECRNGETAWRANIKRFYRYEGSTLLIAAMRCYVASKLGNEVEIPDEFV